MIGNPNFYMRVVLAFIIFQILICCTYHPKEKRLTQFNLTDGQIVRSFYEKKGDTIEFTRLLAGDHQITMQTGQIFLGDYAMTLQRFKETKVYNKRNGLVDSLTQLCLAKGLRSKLYEDRDVMFIQIVPDPGIGNFESLGFLNLRQDVEGEIDNRFKQNRIGEWFAGDMGVGANMLFFVDDWERAITIVKQVLTEENLLDHVLIAKRIVTEENDWNYEIVYPPDFEGPFNSM